MLEVSVSGLVIDTRNNAPVVILKEVDGERILPIWIGPFEATAIASELAEIKPERPMAHDLIKEVIDQLNAEVTRVFITSLVKTIFYAELFLRRGRTVAKIDARPSDCIAVALRTKAPIFVDEELMKNSLNLEKNSEADDTESLRERLRQINPEDFGTFML